MLPAQNKQPDGLPCGIYFNLKASDYHKDTALSHGGMVHLLEAGFLHYWINGPLNPKKKEFKATPPMIFGTRSHELLLDPKYFHKKYCVTGGGWAIGMESINTTDYYKIKESVDEIKKVPKAAKIFTRGYPEVTIIFTDPLTGIRCRVRLDWLRVYGGIDYKRSFSIQNNPLGFVIRKHGYDIQEALYRRAILIIKEMLRAGTAKAYGDYDPDWLERFINDDRAFFKFLFQRSESPYIFRVISMSPVILDNAITLTDDALRLYSRGITAYGLKRPPGGTGETEEFSEYHMPRSAIDRGDHQLS